MITSFDPRKPVREIIGILHKYQIPISGISQVMDLVIDDAQRNTVVYNPEENDAFVPYKVRCMHCGKDTKFFLQNGAEIPADLKNSPCYFAKKCDNNN